MAQANPERATDPAPLFRFPPARSYPRFPAAQVPPQPRMTTNCPSRKSVKLAAFGARGDGATDDSGAPPAAVLGILLI